MSQQSSSKEDENSKQKPNSTNSTSSPDLKTSDSIDGVTQSSEPNSTTSVWTAGTQAANLDSNFPVSGRYRISIEGISHPVARPFNVSRSSENDSTEFMKDLPFRGKKTEVTMEDENEATTPKDKSEKMVGQSSTLLQEKDREIRDPKNQVERFDWETSETYLKDKMTEFEAGDAGERTKQLNAVAAKVKKDVATIQSLVGNAAARLNSGRPLTLKRIEHLETDVKSVQWRAETLTFVIVRLKAMVNRNKELENEETGGGGAGISEQNLGVDGKGGVQGPHMRNQEMNTNSDGIMKRVFGFDEKRREGEDEEDDGETKKKSKSKKERAGSGSDISLD